MLKSDHSSFAISEIVPRVENFKEEITEVNEIFVLKSRKKDIPLITHKKYQP